MTAYKERMAKYYNSQVKARRKDELDNTRHDRGKAKTELGMTISGMLQ